MTTSLRGSDVQTFLPFASARQSAACLDRQRLGKQRVGTFQIMKSLLQPWAVGGWVNHPAVKMWRGYELALLSYQRAVCREWTGRGYADTCMGKTLAIYLAERGRASIVRPIPLPWWYGREEFHAAHRSNLLRKAPEYYLSQFTGGDLVKPNHPYLWPTPGDSAELLLIPGTPVDE